MINGKLGIGIIGTGGISNSHADGYLRLGDKVKRVTSYELRIYELRIGRIHPLL